MSDKVYRVLFLSRRNSARSILAEAVLNKLGKGRFVADRAAVEPAAEIDPHVVELLARTARDTATIASLLKKGRPTSTSFSP